MKVYKSCDPCEKRLRLLREKGRSGGVDVSFDDSEFCWYCFALNDLQSALNWETVEKACSSHDRRQLREVLRFREG